MTDAPLHARVLVVALALVAVATPGLAGSPGPFEALGLVPFESDFEAPDFSLPGLDGRPVSLSGPAASPTLLVFWATW